MSAERHASGAGDTAIRARQLSQGYRAGEDVFTALDVEVARGELVALVGPNGAGKSTLLRTLVGISRARAGNVSLLGRDLEQMSRREIALAAAFVPQNAPDDLELTVREVVAMGRTPHLGRFRPESVADRGAIERALERADLVALTSRPFRALSGGEQKRVMVARALAQDAPLLVLDEPTASLDLRHAHQVLALARAHVDAGGAALAAIHDLGLAARFADRVVVLARGRLVADGAPREVLTATTMREVFGVRAHVVEDEGDLAVVVRGPTESE